jgi:ribosome-associated translation inhibitor RaiA
MKSIEQKIIEFEFKFNENEGMVVDVEVEFIEETEDTYIANSVIYFENGDIVSTEESQYPKKLIDLFEG